MKLWVIAVACALAMAAARATPAAQAQPVEFKAPPIGLRIVRSEGSPLEVVKVEGMTVTTRNGSGEQTDWVGIVLGLYNVRAYDFARGRPEAIWPLGAGKRVTFDISGRCNYGTPGLWANTLHIRRYEQLTIPAGTFHTLVIEHHEKGLLGCGYGVDSRVAYWYAPAVGFIVKRQAIEEYGRVVYVPSWEAVAIERPR